MPTKLEAALTYASWGWKVIPVVPNGKIPATAHGVKDATDDPEKIKSWWTRNPDMNIGIAAGETSGIIVFDIDPRNGGDDSWDKWLAENGKVPDGIMAITAGGGNHYIAKYQPGIRSCKLKQGIDLLSDGRYFVAYPSVIENRSYEWEAESDPFEGVAPFSIPQRWLSAMEDKRAERVSAAVGDLIKGDRNNGLTSLGGAMRRLGMQENEILQALMVINDTRCVPALPDSEIRQIARSVCRYEPDFDLAADVAFGSEVAEMLLAANKEDSDYFFTRATSFLTEPAPIEWVIKNWFPTQSVSMIYGESGVGKSFVALDMACSISAGLPWQGIKTKQGVVVYLAGEGNYGIRQRIASWCKAHNISSLDNLLISNKPIDLDGAGSAIKVLDAVRELTDSDVVCVITDTLNNHMSGDENSARDTRTMINNSKIIASSLNSSVMFVHHTGLNDASKHRARGSSAWKGALDVSVLISRASSDVIKISCEKMKDAQEPEPLFGSLEYVNLGWTDDDGEEIKGAVFELRTDYVETTKSEPKANENMKIFTKAWFATNAELSEDGNPIISRSALADYLEREGIFSNDGTLRNNFSLKFKNGFLNTLFLADIIKCHTKKGRITDIEIINQEFANPMRLSKNEAKYK